MTIQEILAKFEGVEQKSPNSWMARCPAHGDKNPSLSITQAPDGKILLHCFAGCTVEEIVGAVGLRMCDIMPDRPRAAASAAKREGKKRRDWGEKICEYQYRDESGAVLYRVERYKQADGAKTFVQSRVDPASRYGWSYGLHDKATKKLLIKYCVPYNLPTVVQAASAGKSIFVLEGEKDVENFVRVTGCCATCNSAGALKWGRDWPSDWVKWFRGAKAICVIADNDPETKTVVKKVRGKDVVKEVPHWKGQKHAADIRRKLRAAGYEGKIRLMVMPDLEMALEGRENKSGIKRIKDFSDWMEARQAAGLAVDRAAFVAVVNAAAEWPAEWDFDDAALDGAAAGDGLRGKWSEVSDAPGASSTAAVTDGGAGATNKGVGDNTASDGADGERVGGRFGRRVPRTPDLPDEYMVDFDIGAGERVVVRFECGTGPGMIFAIMYSTVARKMPKNEVPSYLGVRIKTWSVALWLLTRGRFFWNVENETFENCLYLDRDQAEGNKLLRIMSDKFYAFVGKNVGLDDVDPKKGDMAKILGLVKQIAMDPEYSTPTRPEHSWARRGDVIYISNGDTQVCRVSSAGVEMVENGTDGVVFLWGKTLAPWTLKEGDGVDPFASTKLFRNAAYEEANGAMNVRLWALNMFASHRTKPPILITGPAGSGKTRMAKGIKEVIGLRQEGVLDLSVQQLEASDKGLDAFWATVHEGRLEVFDNFDSRIPWAIDTLQNAATDGQTKRRTLYSNSGITILKANASIILTSNNPKWASGGNGGVADRLIIISLERNQRKSEDAELSAEIAANRDDYMTWIARTLSRALAVEPPADEEKINDRHPDYGTFSLRLGAAMGDIPGVVRALRGAEMNKKKIKLLEDVAARAIVDYLMGCDGVWKGTAGELSTAIITQLGDDAGPNDVKIYSPKKIGSALSKTWKAEYQTFFMMAEPRILRGKALYEFSGITPAGKLAFGGGVVDFEGSFPKTLGEGAGAEVYPNNPIKSTTPPLSRAGDNNSFREDEEEKEVGIYDDSGFDF